MFKRLAQLLLGLLLLIAVVMFAWYQIDGIPLATTENFMSGPEFTSIEEQDGSLVFTPVTSNGYGIVIMHGALTLWASSMPNDYRDITTPIIFIWGDTDGLLPAERLRLGQANLPRSVKYVTLEGANHKNFAMYTHQFFDNTATIDWMKQIDFANETTAAFFSEHH